MASANDAVGGGSAETGDNSQQTSGVGGVLGTVGDKLSGLVGGTADSNKGEGYVEKGKFQPLNLKVVELDMLTFWAACRN